MLIFLVKVVCNHLSECSLQQFCTNPAHAMFLALLALQFAVRCQLFCRQSSFSTRMYSLHCKLTQQWRPVRSLFTLARHCSSLEQWRSVPRRERQLLVLVCVVDGGLQVYGDGVISRDFGGNVDGLHAQHGVAAGHRVRNLRQRMRMAAHLTGQKETPARPPRPSPSSPPGSRSCSGSAASAPRAGQSE